MADSKGFTIEISSPFEGFWRYNAALMCGLFDAAENRTGFASAEDTVAEAGANLSQKPADYPAERKVCLTTGPCDHLRFYVYLIPHTLPANNAIGESKPFRLDMRIGYGGKHLRTEHFDINQWSGASLELRIESEE